VSALHDELLLHVPNALCAVPCLLENGHGALRERALSNYRDCREEGAHRDAARYDCVASTLALSLRLLDATLAAAGEGDAP
jgi:hypothetical protein